MTARRVISIGYGDPATNVPSSVTAQFAAVVEDETIICINTTPGRIWSYLWELIDEDEIVVETADTVNAEFTTPAPGLYSVRLTVVTKNSIEGSVEIDDIGQEDQTTYRAPDVPVLTATPVSDSAIDLDWLFNNGGGTDDIDIEVSTTGGGVGFAALTTETATGVGTYQHTGLAPGSTRYYRARGHTTAGADPLASPYSAYSPEVSATTAQVATPPIPTGLGADETTRDADTISYDLTSDAIPTATSVHWWIEPSTDGGYSNGSTDVPNIESGDTLDVSDQIARQSGIDESVLVVAGVNIGGRGPTKRLVIPIDGNLRQPVFNSAIPSGNNVALTYTEDPNADAASEYKIERSDDNGLTYAVIATKAAGTAAPQYVDLSLAAGAYLYRVRAFAVSSGLYSNYSAIKSATVNGAPPSGWDHGRDFAAMNSLADLSGSSFSIVHPLKVFFDDGTRILAHTGQPSGIRGIIHVYDAKPLVCGDQFAVMQWTFGAGFTEFWLEDTLHFSTNWTTENDNCSSPQPDYKTILFDFTPANQVTTGRARADWKIGVSGNAIAWEGTGFPNPGVVPPNGGINKRSVPVSAYSLADGLPHVVRLHYKYELNGSGVPVETMQSMIDGQLIHSFKDFSGDLGTASIKKIRFSVNRNLGATEEMYVHRTSSYLWRGGNNPGWFDGVAIDDQTD